MTLNSINPATGEPLQAFSQFEPSEIEASVKRATDAFRAWKGTALGERVALVEELANSLEATRTIASRLMSLEMGKTLVAANAEIDKCIEFCRHSAEFAPDYLADQIVRTDYKLAATKTLPLGPILLIMPWNFPFWQVIRVAIPAILAGNVCLLKHASNVPQCALKLDSIFTDAGFPQGVFTALLIGAEATPALLADQRIKAVSLTGSEAAGAAVASTCGEHIKKAVLELGGSDPFIVMPSADLDAALDSAIISRIRNNGQSCIAAKRMIIHADIYDQFKEGYLNKIAGLIVGDPFDPDTDIGPLVSEQALREANEIIENAVSQGAIYTTGEQTPPEQGFYARPGILENINSDMPAYNQELFSPTAMFFSVADFDEAILLANDIPYGLSSVLFSSDDEEINRAILEIEAGSTFVNRYASSDIRLPFGGIKRSGYGREMARAGMLEFTNLKTVIIAN